MHNNPNIKIQSIFHIIFLLIPAILFSYYNYDLQNPGVYKVSQLKYNSFPFPHKKINLIKLKEDTESFEISKTLKIGITVSGTKAYRLQVQKNMQKIHPNTYVNPHTGVVSYGKKVKGHELGYKLISRMVDSLHNIQIIRSHSGNTAFPNSKAEAANIHLGSGGKIYWDPDSNIDVDTIDPVTGIISEESRDPSIGLAHELIHGDHYQRGVYYPSRLKLPYIALDNQLHFARIEEQRAIGFGQYISTEDITENQLRMEQGTGKRARY